VTLYLNLMEDIVVSKTHPLMRNSKLASHFAPLLSQMSLS